MSKPVNKWVSPWWRHRYFSSPRSALWMKRKVVKSLFCGFRGLWRRSNLPLHLKANYCTRRVLPDIKCLHQRICSPIIRDYSSLHSQFFESAIGRKISYRLLTFRDVFPLYLWRIHWIWGMLSGLDRQLYVCWWKKRLIMINIRSITKNWWNW